MDPRISMVALGVSDMAAAVKFYEEGLGFPKMESPPTVAFFTLNGSWLGPTTRIPLLKMPTFRRKEVGSTTLP